MMEDLGQIGEGLSACGLTQTGRTWQLSRSDVEGPAAREQTLVTGRQRMVVNFDWESCPG